MEQQQPPCDYEEKVKKIAEKLTQSPHISQPLNKFWKYLPQVFLLCKKSKLQLFKPLLVEYYGTCS